MPNMGEVELREWVDIFLSSKIRLYPEQSIFYNFMEGLGHFESHVLSIYWVILVDRIWSFGTNLTF